MDDKMFSEENLSSYELIRLQNLENNRKMMRFLGLIDENREQTKEISQPKPTRKRRYSRSPIPPTRPKSKRIQEQKKKSISIKNSSDWFSPAARAARIDFKKSINSLMPGSNTNSPLLSECQNSKNKSNNELHLKPNISHNSRKNIKKQPKAGIQGILQLKMAVFSVLTAAIVVRLVFEDLYENSILAIKLYLLVILIIFFTSNCVLFFFTKTIDTVYS